MTLLLSLLLSLFSFSPSTPNESPSFPCQEDEVAYTQGDVTTCTHVEGDGWRVA